MVGAVVLRGWLRPVKYIGHALHRALYRNPAKLRMQRMAMEIRAAMESSEDLEKDIAASCDTLEEMMTAVSKELFVDSAANYVVDEGEALTDAQLSAIVRSVVADKVATLNHTFIPILDRYIQGAHEAKNGNVMGVLLAVKREVLAVLTEELPPELQVLQGALMAPTPSDRVELMRRHVNGDAVPSCDPAVLFTTAAKLLEDMEQGQVPEGYDDAAHIHMAAKVCLLREEARQLADEARMGPGGTAPTQSGVDEPGQGEGGIESAPHGAPVTDSPFTLLQGVPQDVVGFLKEVMAVEAPQQRSALLEASFKNEKLPGGAVGARPGAFLDCVRSLQQEMLGPKYGGGAEIDSAVLLRLESVWREAITVLEGLSGDANYFM